MPSTFFSLPSRSPSRSRRRPPYAPYAPRSHPPPASAITDGGTMATLHVNLAHAHAPDNDDSATRSSARIINGFAHLSLSADAPYEPMHVVGEGDSEFLRRVARLSLMDRHANASHDSSDSSWSTSSPPSSPGYASSATSFDFDRNSDMGSIDARSAGTVSPAPSLYSLTSSMRDVSTKTEYGRAVNTYSEIYRLAADEEEAQRLDTQHLMLKEIMGDYVEPMYEILSNNDDPLFPKSCLDVGCGSGAWILDVARDFPHVNCVAVDLVPMPTIADMPPNLRFEVDDVNLGLEHFSGEYDVVHARLVSSGIRDYYKLVHDAALALRPRGLAFFIEFDFRVYDINKQPLIPTTQEIWGDFEPPENWTGTGMGRVGGGSAQNGRRNGLGHMANGNGSRPPTPYLARWFTLAGQAARKRGANIDAAALLHRWISEDRNYEDVVLREFYLATSPWAKEPNVRRYSEYKNLSDEDLERHLRWGDVMGEDLVEFLRSGRPLLLSTGVPSPRVDELQNRAMQEVLEARIPMYMRIYNVYARKRQRQYGY